MLKLSVYLLHKTVIWKYDLLNMTMTGVWKEY